MGHHPRWHHEVEDGSATALIFSRRGSASEDSEGESEANEVWVTTRDGIMKWKMVLQLR